MDEKGYNPQAVRILTIVLHMHPARTRWSTIPFRWAILRPIPRRLGLCLLYSTE